MAPRTRNRAKKHHDTVVTTRPVLYCNQRFWVLHGQIGEAEAALQRSKDETRDLRQRLEAAEQCELVALKWLKQRRMEMETIRPQLRFARDSLSRDLTVSVFGLAGRRGRRGLAATCRWFMEVLLI